MGNSYVLFDVSIVISRGQFRKKIAEQFSKASVRRSDRERPVNDWDLWQMERTFPKRNFPIEIFRIFCIYFFFFENAPHRRTWMRHKKEPINHLWKVSNKCSSKFLCLICYKLLFFILDSNLSLNAKTDWILKEKYSARTRLQQFTFGGFWRLLVSEYWVLSIAVGSSVTLLADEISFNHNTEISVFS